jgi:DNA repair exonuclease SbcCD ATPase subunit
LAGTELRVTVDGRDVDSRTRDGERRALLDAIGFTPELWSATVHVNGIAGNPLIRGTSAARCQFLERVFDLDRWAARHGRVGEVLSQMKRADQDLDDARRRLEALGDATDERQARRVVADLENRRAEAVRRARRLSDHIARLESLPKHPGKTVAELSRRRRELQERADGLVHLTRAHAAWEAARDQAIETAERRKSIQNEIRNLNNEGPTRDPRELDDIISSLGERIRRIEAAAAAERAVKAWLPVARAVADRHGMRYRDVDELAILSRSWAENLKPGAKSCPVCGGRLRGEVDADQVAELARLVDALPNGRIGDVLAAVGGDAAKLRDRVKDLVAEQRRSRRLAELRSDLERLPKAVIPDPPRGDPRDASRVIDALGCVREAEARARQWEAAGLDPRDADDLDAKRARVARLDDLVRRIDERLATARSVLERASSAARERAELEKTVERLESEVSLRPAWKALQMAYSPNGMRLWLLSELLEALIAGLNAGSHSTRDRVEYGYKLSRNRELTLTASNARGTFDVRMLSGAESGLFCLNLLSVLLPLIPAARRSSVLILDEIDANCSPASRDVMASEYIPRLSRMVDSLWVVSPYGPQDFKSPGSDEYLVVKRNGISSLIGPDGGRP